MELSELSKSIKKRRELLNLTQEQLAELLNVSTHYIYELERGTKYPSVPVLLKIADVLNVSLDLLFTKTEIENSNTDNLSLLISSLSPKKRETVYKVLAGLLPYLNL